jgi:Zn-dependent protease with chaperone function
MASARRLYWLAIALGALGIAVTVLVLVVAGRAVRLEGPSLDALAAACRSFKLLPVTAASLGLLVLGSLGIAVLWAGTRAAARELRTRRRFMAALAVIGDVRVGPHRALVIDDPLPAAFCTGLRHPRVYVSRGAVEHLDRDELRAVVAHERHHAARRDPLRMFVVRILAEALFFLPVMQRLARRYQALAELAADEAAVRDLRSPRPLASALLRFEQPTAAAVVGIAPERVDHLLGERPRWELSLAMLAGAVITIGTVTAIVLRLAEVTDGMSVNLPLVLAQVCMLVMAVAPLAIGAASVQGARRLLQRFP